MQAHLALLKLRNEVAKFGSIGLVGYVIDVGTFNWLPPATVTRASYVPGARAIPRQIGRGSWICSPAGSGRGSRCYAN